LPAAGFLNPTALGEVYSDKMETRNRGVAANPPGLHSSKSRERFREKHVRLVFRTRTHRRWCTRPFTKQRGVMDASRVTFWRADAAEAAELQPDCLDFRTLLILGERSAYSILVLRQCSSTARWNPLKSRYRSTKTPFKPHTSRVRRNHQRLP